MLKLINIGFGSMVSEERILAVAAPDSAPVKRMIQDVRDRGLLIDTSYGRKTRAVIITDSGHVFLSALTPEAIASRASEKTEEKAGGEADGAF